MFSLNFYKNLDRRLQTNTAVVTQKQYVNFRHNFFLTELLILNSTSSVTIFTNEKIQVNNTLLYVQSQFNNLALLSLLLNYQNIFLSCVDLGGFYNKKTYTLYTTFSNLLTSDRFTFINLNLTKAFYSLSSILSSCVWLEREAKELDNLIFYGLVDTRRLLQDYTYEARLYNLD